VCVSLSLAELSACLPTFADTGAPDRVTGASCGRANPYADVANSHYGYFSGDANRRGSVYGDVEPVRDPYALTPPPAPVPQDSFTTHNPMLRDGTTRGNLAVAITSAAPTLGPPAMYPSSSSYRALSPPPTAAQDSSRASANHLGSFPAPPFQRQGTTSVTTVNPLMPLSPTHKQQQERYGRTLHVVTDANSTPLAVQRRKYRRRAFGHNASERRALDF
jgi:hypothetical protein